MGDSSMGGMAATGRRRYHRKVKLTCVLGLSLPALGLFLPSLALAQASDPSGTARKALDLFIGGKYAELNQMFAPSTKDSYTETALSKLAAQMNSWGGVQKIGQPSARDMGLVSVVTIPVEFGKQNIDFTFPVNAEGKIVQIYMRPGQIAWQRPDYVKAAAFQTREVTVGGDEWKLPGTLTIPVDKRPCPAVVLVHDAGPSDRDATLYATKIFRDLAEGLSSRGIAVLRYEKRTRQYAAKMMATAYTIDDETAHDALAAVTLLRAQPEIDGRRIYVLGFGVGGFITPRLAAEDPRLAGIILLGAPARALEDWYVEAAESMGVTGPKLAAVKTQASKVKRLDAGDGDAPSFFELPAPYWIDLKGYDPAADAKKLTMPSLVLQGDRDFQVIPKEYEAWKAGLAGRRDAVFKDYPNLNHYFIAGEGKGTEQEYHKPGHVAPEVIDDIAKFIGG
jgi:dienelactone hydrolase